MNWNKLKRPLTLALAAAMLLTTAGCGKKNSESDEDDDVTQETDSTVIRAKDGRFTLGYDADYTMDPITTTSAANALVDCLVYEFAVEVDHDFNVQPNLITSWSSTNGYSWVLTVDTSIKCHDGSTLTASDVAYSINQARRSKTYGNRLNKIWGVTAMDAENIMVTLTDTNYLFPRLLNIPVVKEGGDGIPVGTGPYVFASDMSKLTKFDDYRDSEAAPLKTIYLHENGDAEQTISDYSSALIDLVVNDPTGLSRLGYGSNNEIRAFNTTNLQFVGMNLKREFVCYRDMRAALTCAVDRSYIVDTVLSGSAVETMFPISPESDLYPADLAKAYRYDLNTCRTKLHAAGVEDYDNDGKLEYQLSNGLADINLKFVVCSDNTDKIRAAQKIAADLESIGIGVTVKELSWADYVAAIQAGNYDLFYGEIKLTADFNLTDMLTTNGLNNFYGIDDPEYYSFIHSYLEADDTTRGQTCLEMCQFLADNGPIIPVCFEKQQVLTHRDVVSGMDPTQYNVFYQLKNWSIDLDNA